MIDPATRARLLAGPASTKAQATAAAEIAKAFGIAPAQAAARLAALASLPPSDLAFIAANAPKVRAAAGQLTALSQVPEADLAFLSQYGQQLRDSKVQASLVYLQAHAPAVKQALADSPRQWQNYLWVAVGGQLVFIPLIFLMAGFWDPARHAGTNASTKRGSAPNWPNSSPTWRQTSSETASAARAPAAAPGHRAAGGKSGRPGGWIAVLPRARSGQNSYWTAARWAAIGWMNFPMISRCSGLSR